MSEFITIQVGQCGNQIGSALWPLVLEEYGVHGSEQINIRLKHNQNIQKSMSSFLNIPQNARSVNCENLADLVKAKVKARAVCIDMENGVLSRIQNSHIRSLFDKKCFVSNYPGSGNNWAEGYFEHGPVYGERILNAIQHAVERCDSLHGFLLMFSVGGGTGSGLGTYILKLLDDHYPHIERFVTCVYPIGTEDVITCPYNMAFATCELLEHATCVFPVENRALMQILSRKSGKFHDKISNSILKPFEDMNSIIVDMLLHLTSGSRFPGALNFDMNDINTNMIPYPDLNFLSTGVSCSAYSNSSRVPKEASQQMKDEYFWSACSKTNQLLNHNPIGSTSVLFGASFVGRGAYTMNDMRSYVDKLQLKANFTPWSKKSMKVGLCEIAPTNRVASMLAVFNTSSMSTLFQNVLQQYLKLYQRKAHAHHYLNVPGFEHDNFIDAQNIMEDIVDSYGQMKTTKSIEMSRLPPAVWR